MKWVQVDALIGPSHHYGGLAPGNLASESSQYSVSSPKLAAVQGLEKMDLVQENGGTQLILPPPFRPIQSLLAETGFEGDFVSQCEQAFVAAPHLLSAAFSASSMWTANAGTFIPSIDSLSGRSHFIPANLSSHLHRSLEPLQTGIAFRYLLPFSQHHRPLPSALCDEGAANHMRLGPADKPGIHVFVYGRSLGSPGATQLPARQVKEASESIARLAQIPSERCVFIQQSPEAIDAGAFHNDVVCVSDEGCLILHEKAFVSQSLVLDELSALYERHFGTSLKVIEVSNSEVTLADSIHSYLFNSQLFKNDTGGLVWLAPEQCLASDSVKAVLEGQICEELSVDTLSYVALSESMKNGGGPACLRFRLLLNNSEFDLLPSGVFSTYNRALNLLNFVKKEYPDEISLDVLKTCDFHQKLSSVYDRLISLEK